MVYETKARAGRRLAAVIDAPGLWLALAAQLAVATLAPPAFGDDALRLKPTDAARVEARLLFLPDDAEQVFAPPPSGARRLVVTGAYTRADKFAPGGLVIRQGQAVSPWPQGWDGVLIVSADGRPSLHHKRAVRLGGRTYDLTAAASRDAFVAAATATGISAIQSHLLIANGALDLRESERPKRFRRRLMFQTADGAIGLYESSPRALSLYEAAVELRQLASPTMALNLDMGTYDFCEERAGDAVHRCGVVSRAGVEKLTNLVELTIR